MAHGTGNETGSHGTVYLDGSICPKCSLAAYPAARICFDCLTAIDGTSALLGQGTLYSWTETSIGRGTLDNPVVWGYVDLDDGARVFAEIIATEQDDVRCDARVRLAEAGDPPKFHVLAGEADGRPIEVVSE